MKRREFVAVIGVASLSLTARAQQPGKLPTIGFLGTASASSWRQWTEAFLHRLRELNWIEGRTVAIEFRWADGRSERVAEIVSEFVGLKVDVIVTSGLAVPAAKQATSVIPIVFAIAVDPLSTGLVTSLARPGGNVTGFSLLHTDTAGKRLELLREIMPGLRHLAILANRGYPAAVLEMEEVIKTASALGFEVVAPEIRRVEDIAPSFEAFSSRTKAVYVCADPLANANRVHINSLALTARLPTMHGNREYVETNGLVSYGPNFPDMWRRAADYVDKILRGSKPADLPVQQPTKFELIINLKTARALGLTIPPTLLARADEVIE
jgi:putative ABC transport system substrate-binding protein